MDLPKLEKTGKDREVAKGIDDITFILLQAYYHLSEAERKAPSRIKAKIKKIMKVIEDELLG